MAGEGAVRWRYLGGRENGCPHTKEFKLKPRALDNAAKAFDFLHAKRVRVELWAVCRVVRSSCFHNLWPAPTIVSTNTCSLCSVRSAALCHAQMTCMGTV
jgi:hypothetical protein